MRIRHAVAVARRVLARPDDEARERPTRRTVLSVLAVLAGVLGAGAAGTVAIAGATAEPVRPAAAVVTTQRLSFDGDFAPVKLKRDRFTALEIVSGSDDPAEPAPPLGPVVPAGVAQEYAAKQVAARGWKKTEFSCLVALWSRESGWNAHAGNASGAYGIPQALPGSKMGAGGGDWRNDHKVQINWGLGYIAGRYGTPCGAWGHFQSAGSY